MTTDDRLRDQLLASEAALGRLHRGGWSVAEYTIWFVSYRATVWVVVGELDRERLLAMGATRAEARGRATELAEAIGERASERGAG